MEIGKVFMAVEVNGEACVVVLPAERMLMLVNLAASLSDTGKLPVRKLGPDYRFETLNSK